MSARPLVRRYISAERIFTGMDVVDNAAVVVEGSQVVEVVSADRVPQDSNAVDEFPDATIVPGLVDAHCHLTLAGDGRTYAQMAADPDEMMALACIRNMQRHLASGVTTLRDNGGRNRVTFVVREAINRGYFLGPRLLLAGRPVTPSSGHFHWCNGVADGTDGVRKAVRELVADGADHIKIMASGGGTAGTEPGYPSYSVEELRAAVDTAHGLGRLTTAHARAKESIARAITAGLDCIEHLHFLVPGTVDYGGGIVKGAIEYDPRAVERILQTGMFVSLTLQDPTYVALTTLRTKREHVRLTRQEEARWQGLERFYAVQRNLIGRLLRDGLLPRIVVSSDAGCGATEFGRLYTALEFAVEAGISPQQALQAVTQTAACACGVADIAGAIAPKMPADLLVVAGNPLVDIRALRDVLAVYKDGSAIAPLLRRPSVTDSTGNTQAHDFER